MTTINGRRIRLLKEDVIGIACGWKPESDWMKVISDDGTTYMVHYTDKIEILRATECHCGKDGHALNSVNCPIHGYTISPAERGGKSD